MEASPSTIQDLQEEIEEIRRKRKALQQIAKLSRDTASLLRSTWNPRKGAIEKLKILKHVIKNEEMEVELYNLVIDEEQMRINQAETIRRLKWYKGFYNEKISKYNLWLA